MGTLRAHGTIVGKYNDQMVVMGSVYVKRHIVHGCCTNPVSVWSGNSSTMCHLGTAELWWRSTEKTVLVSKFDFRLT